MSNEQLLLVKIKKRYLLLRIGETILLTAGVALFSLALIKFVSASLALSLIVGFTTGTATVVLRVTALNLFSFNDARIATYLNQHYLQLEVSSDLLLSDRPDLSSLQKIQRERVYQVLRSLERNIRFPHHIIFAVTLLFISTGIWFVADRIDPSATIYSGQPGNPSPNSNLDPLNKIVSLKNIAVTINPPAYTRYASATSSSLPLKVIEGSIVTWVFQFNGNAHDVTLIFPGKDTVQLKSQKGAFTFQRTIREAGFYQFSWTDTKEKIHQSDYYPIELIKDEAPQINVKNLTQFVELKLTDRLMVDLEVTLSDDFGLTDSHIIATVSKGSGESVKFREETLRFSAPVSFSEKLIQASRTIDLIKLGLEPGDELYFYIEAFDNKIPVANISRTETFFIALKDTSSYEMAEGEGTGVDVLPEYFRSQRQIIIDSEKLLEEQKQKKITKELFNAKSNELGYDQKVLRLRYGQFTGDEEELPETETGESDHADEEETTEDVIKKMGHAHDTENENNLVVEKPVDPDDQAALFQQSIKTKLRTAMTLMWDAELQLRLYEPGKSLPYQYKILKLLKEISSDSRIYVHRSGFDPPPLKEEKRLSGDLTEVKNSFTRANTLKEPVFPAIHNALKTIEELLQSKNSDIGPVSEGILQKAGNELAGVAMQQPGSHLKSLSLLKSLLSKEIKPDQVKPALIALRESFWSVLPPAMVSPDAKSSTTHSLDLKFLQQLEVLKHER